MSEPVFECVVDASCAVCGSAEPGLVVARRARGGVRVRNVACRRCGHVQLSPRPTEQAFEAARAAVGESRDGDFGARSKYAQAAATYVASLLEVEPGQRVLELGCGDGQMLAFLRDQHGAWPSGVGANADQARLAHSLGVDVFVGSFRDYAPELVEFEHVVITDELRQTPDPVALLVDLRRVLAPHARVLIQVPNLQQPRGALSDNFGPLDLHSFDMVTLALVLQRAGYRSLLAAEDQHITIVAEPIRTHVMLPMAVNTAAIAAEARDGEWIAECLLSYEALEDRRREILSAGPSVESISHVARLLSRSHFFQPLAETVAELVEHLMGSGAVREAYVVAGAALCAKVEAPVRERFAALAEAVGFALRRTRDEELRQEAELQSWLDQASRGAARSRYHKGGPMA